jgi:hypothetical protein
MPNTTRQKLRYMSEKTGWVHLMKILDEASKSDLIGTTTEASRWVNHMRKVVYEAFKARSVSEIKGIIDDELTLDHERVISNHARKIANKGHSTDAPIIAWLREEWAKSKGKYSKQAFAEKYVPKIQEKFGISRKERTISESWLRGL